MNTQSSILVTLVLWLVLSWLLKNFFERRISSGQALFWLAPLLVAQVLVVFPSLIDHLSVLWGNLVPISWITVVGMAFLIFYLLYVTVRLNRYSKVVDLARSVAYLERRLREVEAHCADLSHQLAQSQPHPLAAHEPSGND